MLGKIFNPWFFVGVIVISSIVAIIALRTNNEHMALLRSQVYAADKNNGDVEGALKNLQSYVTGHMNTDLSTGPNSVYPPIQLKYTYDRLVQARSQQAAQANVQLYTDAQHYCEKLDPVDFSGHNRVPCIESYVQTHGVQPAPVPDSLFKFDFISPWWSPDIAGWSLVVVGIGIILGAASLLRTRRK